MQRFPGGLDDDRERRELLAAMYGVYAATQARSDGGRGALRPLSLADSIAIIERARGPLQPRAYRVAGARLAVAALREGRPELRAGLFDLVGPVVAKEILAIKGPLTPARIMFHVYAVFGMQASELAAPHYPDVGSDLDLRTLVTKVSVGTIYQGSFAHLATVLDPRSWSSSPFWLAAEKVILVDGRFVPDPDPPPLGQSWSGYFYEYVEWYANGAVVSAFQSYLNVSYRVEEPRIELSFSLYSAQGSMVLARIADSGVDVDSGGSAANAFRKDVYLVTATKRVRFSDLVTRSTPHQGGEGAGQELNYQAPAIVGLWLNDLFYESLHEGASR